MDGDYPQQPAGRAAYDERRQRTQQTQMFEINFKQGFDKQIKKTDTAVARVQGDYELVPPVVWHHHREAYAGMRHLLMDEWMRGEGERRVSEHFAAKYDARVLSAHQRIDNYHQASVAHHAQLNVNANAVVDIT
jgi:hypothetical protein